MVTTVNHTKYVCIERLEMLMQYKLELKLSFNRKKTGKWYEATDGWFFFFYLQQIECENHSWQMVEFL